MKSLNYIKEKGLKDYLDNSAALHNGNGYEEFAKRVKLNEAMTVMARAFKVDRRTIMKWVVIYEQEVSDEN